MSTGYFYNAQDWKTFSRNMYLQNRGECNMNTNENKSIYISEI